MVKKLYEPETDYDFVPAVQPGAHDPWATGVLKKEHHHRLVANLDKFARVAGIDKKWVSRPLEDYCVPDEIKWFRTFPRHSIDVHGLVYVGKGWDPTLETRMKALAGAFLRNFTTARYLTAKALAEAVDGQDTPTESCILVPNFFAESRGLPAWRGELLYDALLRRTAIGKKHVLGVADLQLLRVTYGDALWEHLTLNYQLIEA